MSGAAAAGGMIQAGVQAASKGYGDRADRRFQERLSALTSVNDYKKFIAQMMADDPAKMIKLALKGQTSKNFYGKGKFGKGGKDPGSSGMSKLPQAMQDLLGAMGDIKTYGLSKKPGGGYNYKAPTFSPVVSEKYKPHLGGIAGAGGIQQFGGASTGDPSGVPNPGFTQSGWFR